MDFFPFSINALPFLSPAIQGLVYVIKWEKNQKSGLSRVLFAESYVREMSPPEKKENYLIL